MSTRRARSLAGCVTCRSRHVKCDETHPECAKCRDSGLVCGGYERNIQFDNAGSFEADSTRSRRPLFTEAERLRMSDSLVLSVAPKLVFRYLNEIEATCESIETDQEVCISRGPFNVFRIRSTPSVISSVVVETAAPSFQLPFDHDYEADLEPCELSPSTQAWFASTFEHLTDSPRTATSPFWSDALDLNRVTEIGDHENMTGLPIFRSSLDKYTTSHTAGTKPALFKDFNSPLSSPELPLSSLSAVPANAVFLLSHYSTTVINLLTPFRHTKTPWHILFIPHVKTCLAAIVMSENLDHASLCNFYGTLALSAFSVGGIQNSQSWLDEGTSYKIRAQNHARMMLKAAYDVPKVSKYKSILMALITMVQTSLFVGDQEHTEHFFFEAEKFIRLRGLKRRKSRKVRLLHHCYVFERLFYESTSVSSQACSHRSRMQEAVQKSGVIVYGQDSTSFSVPTFQNLDEELQRAKGQEEGENDLHLENIGDFPATLYPEVFGVPETYMLMLSLVIRLGKERDRTHNSEAGGAMSLKAFLEQAKAVERTLLRMHRDRYADKSPTTLRSHNNAEVMENMLQAIHEALLIYFYRRIYDIDASLLQQRVTTVRNCLLRCEALDESSVCGSAGFVWPAFIAACEAEDSEVQASFANLLTKVAQRSGLSKFANTLLDIEHIWLDKRKAGGVAVSWLDVMRKKAIDSFESSSKQL